jgi:hypothetical protein
LASAISAASLHDGGASNTSTRCRHAYHLLGFLIRRCPTSALQVDNSAQEGLFELYDGWVLLVEASIFLYLVECEAKNFNQLGIGSERHGFHALG